MKSFRYISRLVPINITQKLVSVPLFIPYYHMVSNEDVRHVKHLYSYKNEKQFTEDLQFLISRYHAVSLSDVIDHVQCGRSIPDNSFLLTFDDGYSEMFSVVSPILIKRGIPAVFFINTDFLDNRSLCYKNKVSLMIDCYLADPKLCWERLHVAPAFHNVSLEGIPEYLLSIPYRERRLLEEVGKLLEFDFDDYLRENKPYLTREQLKEMIGWGFSFGAHSLDHPLYAELSLQKQLQQTVDSVRHIKEEFRLSYSVFSFPHSDQSVTRAFFDAIKDSVDLTFGTAGLREDIVQTNLQRINFEENLDPARRIMARHLLKKRILLWLKKSVILRD